MTSRGRGRPPTRQSAEPAPGPGRRSTRQQAGAQPQPEPQIDPAITAVEGGSMLPPRLPSSRRGRSQENARAADIARRGTRREVPPDESSMVSINSVAESGPSSSAPLSSYAHPQRRFGTPARGSSVVTSTAPSPGQVRAKVGLMKRSLDRLLTATAEAFDHLSLQGVDRDVFDVQRKANQDVLEAYLRTYLAQNTDSYANVAWVLDQVGAQSNEPIYARFSQILSMANLVSLLDTTVDFQEDDPTAHSPAIQAIDSAFPRDFNAQGLGGGYVMDPAQILEQVLEIRTQLLIINLQVLVSSNEKFNPYEAVRDVFCQPGSTVKQLHELKDNPGNEQADIIKEVPGFPQKEMPNMGSEWILTRIRSLCQQLPTEEIRGDELQLEELTKEYPFDEFVSGLEAFIKATFNKTRALLESGSSSSPDFLNPASAIQSQLAETVSQFGGPERSIGIQGVLDVMNDIETHQGAEFARLASQDIIERSHQIQAGTYPPISSVSYPPQFSSYGEPHVQSNGAIYAQSAAQATNPKRRRAGDDGEAAPAPAKRPRARRKQNPVQSSAPVASGALPSTAVDASQYPLPPSSLAAEPDFDAVRIRSREISAANRKAKEPQVRSAWVRNDVKLLVKAVDTYKCKWSIIQKEIEAGTIPFEIPRDQQALRDKARLLKQDFLKADGVLPPSFDLVVLGKKEVNAVIAVGKNPYRKEADIINGIPVNTEYQADPAASPAAALPPATAQAALPAPEPASAPAPDDGAQVEGAGSAMPVAQMGMGMDADAESEPVAA
ncbi:hypothetical protein QBC47DRAFT_374623 [Echria macrotheca]|uniref:Uncharacterized protein n=1 Tax=Echria macrotheca TaxID=438768 RepID=A0AAJ0BJM2_9PEZI|nr:hypothetical protein QBC47DRAFT_374623 [Echria macrotheca]